MATAVLLRLLAIVILAAPDRSSTRGKEGKGKRQRYGCGTTGCPEFTYTYHPAKPETCETCEHGPLIVPLPPR